MLGQPPSLPPHLDRLVPSTGFPDVRVLVVGDLMLDRYIIGQANRISPEAPVPIVAVERERVAAGGAGNVALNIAGLKAQAVIAGIVGSDIMGSLLADLLKKAGVDVSGMVKDASRPTTCKTRVMCGSHQLVRFDEEVTSHPDRFADKCLRETILQILNTGVHAVILSDYAKGVLSSSFTRFIIAECSQRQLPVFVDPKRTDYRVYAGATCLTPNLREFQDAIQSMAVPGQGIITTGQLLRGELRSPMLLVTQGSHGMTFLSDTDAIHFPALAEEVYDVSGAGDTVVATLATAFAAGLSATMAVELANIAASVVVRKIGTAPISWNELNPESAVLPDVPMLASVAV